MWPNLFLVGAMKAGTTSLTRVLASHPEVYIPPVKEPNYFCSDLYKYGLGAKAEASQSVLERVRRGETFHHAYMYDRDCYLALLSGRNTQHVIADCSTTYLYSEVAADNIAKVAPAAKILISLRNPIDRAFSEFLMNCSIGTACPPFSNALDLEAHELKEKRVPVHHRYVTAGLYWKQVERYLRIFGRDNVLILRFEDMKRDFGSVMARVWEFIGVAHRPLVDSVHENDASFPKAEILNRWLEVTQLKEWIRRSVPQRIKDRAKSIYYGWKPAEMKLAEDDKARLKRVFTPDVEGLSDLLGEDLTGWVS